MQYSKRFESPLRRRRRRGSAPTSSLSVFWQGCYPRWGRALRWCWINKIRLVGWEKKLWGIGNSNWRGKVQTNNETYNFILRHLTFLLYVLTSIRSSLHAMPRRWKTFGWIERLWWPRKSTAKSSAFWWCWHGIGWERETAARWQGLQLLLPRRFLRGRIQSLSIDSIL